MKVKSIFKNIFLGLTIFIFLFVIPELATRIIFESNTVLNINIGGFKKYHPTRKFQLKENYHRSYISINSYGILGPEFNLEPPPRKVRILIIGDSVTFCPPERNYPKVLEEQLNMLFPDNPVEVIIGAVPGYSSYEALDWYNEFLYKLKPDITIIALGWNDMWQFNPFGLRYKNEKLSYRGRTIIGRLMEHLYVLRIPYFFKGWIEQSKPVDLSGLTADEKKILEGFTPIHFKNNLELLIGQLKKRGSIVYLVSLTGLITYTPTEKELQIMHFPRNLGRKLEVFKAIYEKYMESLEVVSKSTQIPLIDLREVIRSPRQRKIFRDTIHLNAQGVEVFGRFIAEAIKLQVHKALVRKLNLTKGSIK